MKLPREDVLNALVTELIADQVIRALELGYKPTEVKDAVRRGMEHGTHEYSETRRELYGKGRGL